MRILDLLAASGTTCLILLSAVAFFLMRETDRLSLELVSAVQPLLLFIAPVLYIFSFVSFWLCSRLFPLYFPGIRPPMPAMLFAQLTASFLYFVSFYGSREMEARLYFHYLWFVLNAVFLHAMLARWVFFRVSAPWKWAGALLFPVLYGSYRWFWGG